MRIDSRYLEVAKLHPQRIKRVLLLGHTFGVENRHGGYTSFRTQLTCTQTTAAVCVRTSLDKETRKEAREETRPQASVFFLT